MSRDRPFLAYRRLLGYLSGSHARVLLILLALGVTSLCTLTVPWLAKNLFRDAVLRQQQDVIFGSLGVILGVLVVISIARYVAEDQLEYLSLRMTEQVRNEIAAKLVRLPARFFVEHRPGDLVSRAVHDVRVLKTFLQHAFFVTGCDLLQAIGSIGLLFFMSWQLALMTLALAPVGIGVVMLSSKWVRHRFYGAHVATSQLASVLSEQVRSVSVIQAYGAAEYEQKRFAESARHQFREALLANRVHIGSKAVINVLGAIAVVFVLGFGASRMQLGDVAASNSLGSGMTLERLLGFALYSGLLVEPLTRLSRTNLEIQQSLAAGQRIFELLDLEEEHVDGRRRLTDRPRGDLHVETVSFRYRPDEPVLSDIDLRIEAGETVAIVGPSGSGKSTLVYLVLRFYDPTNGRVLLDGQDLRELCLADLRRHIGWVGQEPHLFSGTIAENIRYGSWTATQEQIEQAAALACADEFIRELPHGYSSRIGERGVDLSGGQRARLALARVILRSPAIVMLDEVTASLDSETEQRIWRQLAGWMAGRTTLIITHRLHTVLDRPRIVVIENGRKVGDGTAQQLQRRCATFNRIFIEQMNLAPRAA